MNTKHILQIQDVSKKYSDGFEALKNVNLDINTGEIFALLGPNGAGKTTLISIICGIVNATVGKVTVDGHDHVNDYRQARSVVGLVPQELYLDPFMTVSETLTIARGLFGKPADADYLKQVLSDLSLWDKRDNKVQELSGGMKRRVLIGKALMNEPKILFLDEPTAGVDVELRRSMWDLVWKLKEQGTTIILTTHYIEEAQEMADRVGVITDGEIKLVETKDALMSKLGEKYLDVDVAENLEKIPSDLSDFNLALSQTGDRLTYTYKTDGNTGITTLLSKLKDAGIHLTDVSTRETSLEEIFVQLTHESPNKSID